jgi:hypothetical protein
MMGRTLDPETLVANQAKMTLGNNPKAKSKHHESMPEGKDNVSIVYQPLSQILRRIIFRNN